MMNSKLKRLLIILPILILWVIFAPSHYQKGGVENYYYKLIQILVYTCSLIWIFPMKQFSLFERVLLLIFVPLIALVISTFFVMEFFIDWRYGEKTWFLWENNERILTNSVYFGITFLLIIGMVEVYKLLKGMKLS